MGVIVSYTGSNPGRKVGEIGHKVEFIWLLESSCNLSKRWRSILKNYHFALEDLVDLVEFSLQKGSLSVCYAYWGQCGACKIWPVFLNAEMRDNSALLSVKSHENFDKRF